MATALTQLETAFGDLGFERVLHQPLLANYSFNGGFRYDEWPMNKPVKASKSFVIQECFREEDINRTGPVPLHNFNMFVYDMDPFNQLNKTYANISDSLELSLSMLTNTIGLDQRRLLFVTLENYSEALNYLYNYAGILESQVLLRTKEDALATRDGSGIFAPPGYPGPPIYGTVSVHFSSQSSPSDATDYPLTTDWVEIAEIGPAGGGYGVERLAWAKRVEGSEYDDSSDAGMVVVRLSTLGMVAIHLSMSFF